MMRRLLLLLTVALAAVSLFSIFIVAPSAWGQTGATESMGLANQLYEEGRFAEAAQMYQELVDQRVQDSTLYYNLGNAYFKIGDLGRAILNYERAARLAPRDGDIQANLEIARGQTIDRYEAEGEPIVSQLATLARSWLTLNEMALLTLLLWAVLAGLILGYRHSRTEREREMLLYGLVLVGILLVGGLFSLGSRLYVETVRPAAVITAEVIDVVSGPGTQYVTEFTLHSGSTVSLIETRGEWVRLALPGDQLQGWVPASAVAAVRVNP